MARYSALMYMDAEDLHALYGALSTRSKHLFGVIDKNAPHIQDSGIRRQIFNNAREDLARVLLLRERVARHMEKMRAE